MKTEWKGDQFARKIEQAAAKAVLSCAHTVEAEAVLNCPVHDGQLKNSGTVVFDQNTLKARVIFSAAHAASVEYGRLPGKMPPVEPLKKWAKDKLGDENAAFAVAMKIKKKGTEGQPFLRPALDVTAPDFKNVFKRIIGSVIG